MHGPAILAVHDVDDAAAAKGAEVVGLSAGGRIERGARERHREAITGGVAAGDLGVEAAAVGIGE